MEKTKLSGFGGCHTAKIHWRVLAEGVSSALDILQVLHEYAVADTLTSNEELAAQWAAILAQRPPGDFAFDQTQQVPVLPLKSMEDH